ncbi:hypothetical protein MXB_3427 [Myxobolus squamalis]|nr:hypothetical protein MXB_3427 [Myxobolus squamalis]
MTEEEAKILFLQYGSQLTLYGSECFPISYYHIRSRQSVFKYGRFVLYVCTNKLSVRLYDRDETTRPSKILLDIIYSDISTASFKGEYVTVYYHSNEIDKKLAVVFKFSKMEDTLSMFKIFTEFHTFFHCRSVKNVIYYRELLMGKDSFFIRWFFKLYRKRLSADMNKRYMFDVHCTRRQAYEYVYNFLNDPHIYKIENNKSCLSIKYINERYRIHLIPMGLVPENICKRQASLLCKQKPLHLKPDELSYNDPNIKILKSKIKNKSLESISTKEKDEYIPSISYKFNDYFEHIITTKSDNLKDYTWEQLEKAIIYKKNTLVDPSKNNIEKNESQKNKSNEPVKGYCIMCMDKDINCVFCPCGHSVACLNCSEKCRDLD